VIASAESAPRVLIAASSLPTRVGLRLALGSELIPLEAADREAAVALAEQEQPRACLLDLETPAESLRAVSEILSRSPDTAVIMLTAELREDEFLTAIRAGASGYLPQALPPGRLPDVVRAVLDGEVAVPRHFVGRLIDELRGRASPRRLVAVSGDRTVEFTAREWEVLGLLRENLPTREIAEQLGISQVTVRRHLGAVAQKLGARSRDDVLGLLRSGRV
jgi:two-component system nitrate/nitrite response regulator NarL